MSTLRARLLAMLDRGCFLTAARDHVLPMLRIDARRRSS